MSDEVLDLDAMRAAWEASDVLGRNDVFDLIDEVERLRGLLEEQDRPWPHPHPERWQEEIRRLKIERDVLRERLR